MNKTDVQGRSAAHWVALSDASKFVLQYYFENLNIFVEASDFREVVFDSNIVFNFKANYKLSASVILVSHNSWNYVRLMNLIDLESYKLAISDMAISQQLETTKGAQLTWILHEVILW